ncbi:MAG: glycoside hydrolase family 15 protein [Thermoplasmata archaeon]
MHPADVGRNRPAGPPESRNPELPPITHYGVIGNLETCALVSPNGSIDWACLPTFSSASVFGRLLDPDKGGFHSILPVGRFRASQEYLAGTNLLRTRFTLGGGRWLTLVDFLPLRPRAQGPAPPWIVRIASAEGGPVAVRVRAEPRPGYGRSEPRWEVQGPHRAIIRSRGESVTLTSPGTFERTGGGGSWSGTVEPGTPWRITIAGGTAPVPERQATRLCHETVDYWRRWAARGSGALGRFPTRWRGRVLRSLLALKLLSERESGAFVAAATTSLPEWPGGPRNWDYRYAWLRDAAFSAQVLAEFGHLGEAERFLRWVVRRIDASRHAGRGLRILYDAHGHRIPRERVVSWWKGYEGSRPVRIGNAAECQFQLDVFGELIAAAELLSRAAPEYVRRFWPKIRGLAEVVARRWTEPDQGIWEARGPPRHYVHSKVMAWVALDRARALAERFEGGSATRSFSEEAELVRAAVLRRGFDTRHRAFVQAFDRSGPDAANLRIPLVGFLPFDDPRVVGTVEFIGHRLADGPFVRRFLTRGDPLGPEGAFLACSFWRVECLARLGRTEEASADWERLVKAGGSLGLFSEEIDPSSGRPLGNYPQALSHIAFLRCAFALFGRAGLPAGRNRASPPPARELGSRVGAPPSGSTGGAPFPHRAGEYVPDPHKRRHPFSSQRPRTRSCGRGPPTCSRD